MLHLLHGNFGLPYDWDACLPPEVPVKAWHLWEIYRNHPETRSLTGFAAWFNNQIEAHPHPGPNHLAGYSLGGRLALHVLADRPALWQQALFLSTHPGLTSDAERTARLSHDMAWRARCLSSESWHTLSDAWNSQPVLRSPSQASPPDHAALEPWRQEIAGAFVDWSLGHQHDQLPILAKLPITGQWLAGAVDPKFNGLAQQTSQSLSLFKHRIIPQAGHRLLTDCPATVKKIIQASLG